jgi:5-methylcytosine-specific restriction endonuclease McrA
MRSVRTKIPNSVRREVALREGCPPGGTVDAECYWCGAPGQIVWAWLHFSNRPGAWVAFPGLELDHKKAVLFGGTNDAENIVLACRACNRSHGGHIVHLGNTSRNGR